MNLQTKGAHMATTHESLAEEWLASLNEAIVEREVRRAKREEGERWTRHSSN